MVWSDVFTAKKNFSDPTIGSPRANRCGLHMGRVLTAQGADASRRLMRGTLLPQKVLPFRLGALSPACLDLAREGVAVVPGFLPNGEFQELREELQALARTTEKSFPMSEMGERGFGKKLPFEGGFDRDDGDTLNRFIDLTPELSPLAHRWSRAPKTARFLSSITGTRHHAEKISLYQTVFRDKQEENPDPQQLFHRDTFHPAYKFWFFLESVEESGGPFVYVPGSHRVTRERLGWEHAEAVRRSQPDAQQRGGAFRISLETIRNLKLGEPRSLAVPANTLVVANVFGFHRRGAAIGGTRRLALHASFRPSPFVPLPY